jgi:hypothetical protein
MDSARMANRSSAATSGFAPRPERAMALREASSDFTARRPDAQFTGCYQFTADSAFKSSALPERFALQPLAADTTVHIVRSVNSEGRIDGGITGSYWLPVSSDAVQVRFAAAGTAPELMIRFPAGSVTGIVTSLSGDHAKSLTVSRKTLTVTRMSCRQ